MSISQRDIKLLWGRAGNRCSFPDCRIKLSHDSETTSESFPIGEQAHIIARSDDGPRGNSLIPQEDRDSYSNLMLLCPTHHTMIDNNPDDYPVEKLHMIKSQHELWVEQTLSEVTDIRERAQDLVYTTLIDEAVDKCGFEFWEAWTSYALSPDPSWRRDSQEEIFEFRQKVISAIWPGKYPELENALITLSIIMQNAVQLFMEHAELRDNSWCAVKFYKLRYNPERYDELLEKYNKWVDDCHNLVFEATKAANWVADQVRKHINPMFFASEGKFLVTYGMGLDGSFRTVLLEYTDEEKEELPDSLL